MESMNLNNKFVVISQQGDEITMKRYIGKNNDGILQFAFSELESESANKALVEDYRKYGAAIFESIEPQPA